jgi:hypothetical protein
MAQQAAVTTETTPSRSFLGGVFASTWQGLIKDLRAPYRPERHYMRGPGPKWHAKHLPTAAAAERAAAR